MGWGSYKVARPASKEGIHFCDACQVYGAGAKCWCCGKFVLWSIRWPAIINAAPGPTWEEPESVDT